jgi:predicted O-methyltransferase YrrM
MTTSLLSRQIEDYTERYTTPPTPVLAELNRQTNLKRGDAVMISGHIQGAFLQMIAHMVRPNKVLEIGTFTGYSAICLAQGLQDGGHLHTIEIDEELEDMAAEYITKAGLRDKITQHIGPAADVIATLDGPFDLVFLDADKQNYERYYDLVFSKLSVGGILIADNVLYDGEVVLPIEQQSKNALAIQGFNDKVRADKRVVHVLAPIRDGLMMVRKVSE